MLRVKLCGQPGKPEEKLAIKLYPKEKAEEGQLRHFKSEVEALECLSHPNVIKLVNSNLNGKAESRSGKHKDIFYAALEFAPHGTLFNYASVSRFDDDLIRFYGT